MSNNVSLNILAYPYPNWRNMENMTSASIFFRLVKVLFSRQVFAKRYLPTHSVIHVMPRCASVCDAASCLPCLVKLCHLVSLLVMLWHVMQCRAMTCHTVPCHVVACSAVPFRTVSYRAAPCACAVPCRVPKWHVMSDTVSYCAVKYQSCRLVLYLTCRVVLCTDFGTTQSWFMSWF